MPVPDLGIFFPDGRVEASLMYIWDGSKPIVWDGSISVVSTGSAIQDGINPAILATVLALTNANPLTTAIVDANGDQITSFGGGVQYTEGDIDATPTGTVAMWRKADNSIVSVTVANPLPTVLLAGTAIVGKVGIDQTTPGTTNAVAIIAGQNGILGGSGVDAANVPRVTLATNVALPAGTNLLGKVSIDQTTPGTTNAVKATNLPTTVDTNAGAASASTIRNVAASDSPDVAVLGAITGAAIITDVDGTIQRYLRGLIKGLITAGTFKIDVNALPALVAGSALVGYVGNKRTYANLVNLTTTNFSGLTTTSGWQSASIDTSGAEDVHFEFQTKGAAGSTGLIDVYVAETLTNGTVFTDGATGTEGTFTAANRKNSRYLGSIQCNTTSAVQCCLKLKDVFSIIPKKFSLIAINNSGGTISATGGDTVFDYSLVN